MIKGKALVNIESYESLTGEDMVSIKVSDSDAKVQFLFLELTAKQFVKALIESYEIKCNMTTSSMDKVGMVKETRKLDFKLPDHDPENRAEIAMREAIKQATPGWMPVLSFDSEDSFTYDSQYHTTAHTTQYRWMRKKRGHRS